MTKKQLVSDAQPDPPDWQAAATAAGYARLEPQGPLEFSVRDWMTYSGRRGVTTTKLWLEKEVAAGRMSKRVAQLTNGKPGTAYRVR